MMKMKERIWIEILKFVCKMVYVLQTRCFAVKWMIKL